MNPAGRTIKLPCYGITITLVRDNGADNPGSDAITSDLLVLARAPCTSAMQRGHRRPRSVLLLAHACAGVEMESPAYIEGIETAVEAIANHVC